MDYKARYHDLVEFLLPYQDIWRNEIMLQYPTPLAAFPAAWIEDLSPFTSPENTWRLAQGMDWDKLSPELASFNQAIADLGQFPKRSPTQPVPTKPQSWVHIIPKKQHELEHLAPLVAEWIADYGLKQLVDIGGGQGHLAQTVAHHYGVKTLSLDFDPNLQDIGRRWQLAKWPESKNDVQFQVHRIDRNDKVFAALLDDKTLTTGLHTCGSLAVAHLEAATIARSHVMNMPCCFHKTEIADCNLSQVAKAKPLDWNLFALTLASGAHFKTSLKDASFRNKVKLYRYTLHFLLCDEFGVCGPIVLGNSPEKIYDGSFADYAREQLSRLNLTSPWSDEKLEAYFHDEKHRKLITQMYAAGIIRDRFGRALESTVIVDRALWLNEHGFKTEIVEIFDPQISPRNLLMMASCAK